MVNYGYVLIMLSHRVLLPGSHIPSKTITGIGKVIYVVSLKHWSQPLVPPIFNQPPCEIAARFARRTHQLLDETVD